MPTNVNSNQNNKHYYNIFILTSLFNICILVYVNLSIQNIGIQTVFTKLHKYECLVNYCRQNCSLDSFRIRFLVCLQPTITKHSGARNWVPVPL